MAAAAWGDEALEALRRMFAQVDAGQNVDDVLDEVQGIEDFRRRIGMTGRKKKKAESWMTPQQEAAYREADARQRELAARLRRQQELADMDEMLNEVEQDEMFKAWLRSQGLL